LSGRRRTMGLIWDYSKGFFAILGSIFFIGLLYLCIINYNTETLTALERDAQNLNQELTSFYKFNISNINNSLTETQLRVQGGVCWHYSDWYINKSRELGYYAKEISFHTSELGKTEKNYTFFSGHSIAVISDKTGYCIMDIRNYKCFKLNGLSEEEKDFVKEINNIT